MSEAPLVSIALPVYNADKTLAASLRSILLQTYQNWELLVIDDGSTDNSLSIARQFADPRITVIENSNNDGISARLNQAIDRSIGKYFARMDADDIAFPQRLELQVQFLESHPKIDLTATGVLYVSNNGIPLGVLPVKETHAEICRTPWNGFYMPHPTWLGKTEWFRSHRYRSSADNAEDQELLFRTFQESRLACLKDVLLAYRQSGLSIRKKLTARYVFGKEIAAEAFRKRQYFMICKLCLNLSLKATADILHLFLKWPCLQNRLLSVPQKVYKQWEWVRSSVAC